ncbi:hypothetical protein F4703DRAFT_1790659 [Phycomyces blakesleeanus]
MSSVQLKHQGANIHPGLQPPAIQVKRQGPDLPSMVIVSNPSRSCFKDLLSVRDYRPNSKDQNSNQGNRYTMKNLAPIQCNSYIHLVGPLLTVGFIFLLSLPSKPAIKDPISVQYYMYKNVIGPLLRAVFASLVSLRSRQTGYRVTHLFEFLPIAGCIFSSVFTVKFSAQGSDLQPKLQAVILIQSNSYEILLKPLPIMAYNGLMCFTVQMNYQAYGISPVLKVYQSF